jgi:hypothetical protein
MDGKKFVRLMSEASELLGFLNTAHDYFLDENEKEVAEWLQIAQAKCERLGADIQQARRQAATVAARLVFCSSCGKGFHGQHGFSHCENHAGMPVVSD